MNRKPPAFMFYPKDWKSSTSVRLMTPEQRGYYIQLLAEAWDSYMPGYLPDNVPLWFLAGAKDELTFNVSSNLVQQQFNRDVATGRYYHPRLVEERDRQMTWREKCSKAGKTSALKRNKLEVNVSSTDRLNDSTKGSSTLQFAFASASAPAIASAVCDPVDGPKVSKVFKKPTAEDVEIYMRKKGFSDPVRTASLFMNHYESNGWKVGKNPMKSWKAAVSGIWAENNMGVNGNGNGKHSTREGLRDERTLETLSNFAANHR